MMYFKLFGLRYSNPIGLPILNEKEYLSNLQFAKSGDVPIDEDGNTLEFGAIGITYGTAPDPGGMIAEETVLWFNPATGSVWSRTKMADGITIVDVDTAGAGLADMRRAVYDTNYDGIVNSADKITDGVNTVTAVEARTHIDDLSIHRVLNDALTTSTNLWSASKIAGAIATGAGMQGWQGRQGFQGSGPQGDQGAQGWGIQGPQGTNPGPDGPQGFQGIQGAQGNQGGVGSQGFGMQGLQGWQGNQGKLGPQGTAANVMRFMGNLADGTAMAAAEVAPTNGDVWHISGNFTHATGVHPPVDYTDGQEVVWSDIDTTWVILGFTTIPGSQGGQGLQGRQGFQGRQGNQGNQGSQGQQGWQGFQGQMGDGVQGVQGNQGWQGFQGFQGLQGLQGRQGPQGGLGIQGTQGAQGWQGFQGRQGFQGEGVQGDTGWQGFQGWQGAQGTGPQGAGGQGNQGEQGAQGWQGRQGRQGDGGQGPQGPQGQQGWQGFQGSGIQGFQGIQGPQGLQGRQGWQGFQGDGIQGYQGSQGSLGLDGVQGSQGWQGNQGAGGQGSQGVQGAQGLGSSYEMLTVVWNSVGSGQIASVTFPGGTALALDTNFGGGTGFDTANIWLTHSRGDFPKYCAFRGYNGVIHTVRVVNANTGPGVTCTDTSHIKILGISGVGTNSAATQYTVFLLYF